MSSELALYGVDISNQQAGGGSFFDNTTMFTGSAVLSGLAGIYNTFVDYGNKFGMQADMIDVARVLETYDRDWYSYYKENKQLIDVAGFVGSALIPGTFGIKGLQAVQAGRAAGAVGRAVSGPLNFFNSRRDYYLEKGLKELATEGPSTFAYVNSNKLAAMGWGVADNVLQNAAFEAAVLLTMNQSPILKDASAKDIVGDAMLGMAVGGVFGGALDAIATQRIFKNAVEGIGKKQRSYDTPALYNRDGKSIYGSLSLGDEVYGLVDSVLSLPSGVLDGDSLVKVANRFTGQTIELNISKQLENTLTSTERKLASQIQLTANKLGVQNTPEVGEAVGNFVFKMIKDGKAAGAGAEEIKQKVGSYMLGLENVRTLVDDIALNSKDAEKYFYIADKVNLEELGANANNIDELLKLGTSRNPFPKNATAKPYEVVGDMSQLKVTASARIFDEAWEQGNDVAIIGGRMRVNPASTILRQVTDPVLVPRRYWNLRTGGVSDEVMATWADMLPAGAKAEDNVLFDGVKSGKKVVNVADTIEPSDVYTATARWAWASQLTPKMLAGATVKSRDLARLEKMLTLDEGTIGTMKIALEDGRIVPASTVDIARHIQDVKLNKAEEFFTIAREAGIAPDMREVGYLLNVPQEWLEAAVANDFRLTNETVKNFALPLESYLKRENFVATWASPRSLVEVGNVDRALFEATETAAQAKNAKYVDTFVTGDLGFLQRVELAKQINDNAAAAVLGKEVFSQLLDLDARNVAKMSNELGVGAGTFSFSNAGYGDLAKLWSQYTGKVVHGTVQNVANANLEVLQPLATKLLDKPAAGAELGVITTMLRLSPNKMVLAPDSTGKMSLVVRELTQIDKATGETFINGTKLDEWLLANPGKQAVFNIQNKETADFLQQWVAVNAERVNKNAVLANAKGATFGWDPRVVYAPPIDTTRFPYFAFVKSFDGALGGTSDVAMITARSQEELSKLASNIPKEYQVFFKSNTEEYYRVKQLYDAQMTLNEPRIDSTLRSQNKLGDFFPEVRTESVLEDFFRYSQQADTTLVRRAVETKYGQLIAELESLGKQYTEVATSQMSGAAKLYDRATVNPFKDYILTALDISKRSSYTLLSKMNELVDSAGTTAYRMLAANTEKAKNGTITWQEADDLAERYGLGRPYGRAENIEEVFAVANRPMDRNLIRGTVVKANSLLSTVGLRLDVANSIVNTVSLPIMLGAELQSLRGLAKTNPEALGALNRLTSISPTGDIAVPSYTKVIGQAIGDILGPNGKTYIDAYRATGEVKNIVSQFQDMLGELAVNPKIGASEWSKKVDHWVEKGATWTRNNFSEDFTRALSARVMDILTEPLVTNKLLSQQEALAYRSVFVNRVNGNYISSQRPIAFQGTTGAAVSLFQTYMFNVLQQLTRHIEDRNARAIITMSGMQGAIFGLNGLPFFEAVNTHIIGNANINDGHRDIYSTVTQAAGKEMGDWLLYGTASAFPLFGDKAPALYTRGDINPRHVTIIPVHPLDIPAVSVGIRVAQNIADVGKKLSAGADISASLLEGLEHNGISRPLAGFAQLAQGYTSTSKGSLISSANEFDAVVVATRMIGAKPIDESVLLNTMFRMQTYKAADIQRLSGLGEVVKTKLRAGQMPTEEEMQGFMKSYASAGGNLQNYTSALQRWSRDANMSVVNQMKLFHNTSYSQRLSEIMSGSSLDDFTTINQQVQE